MYQEELRLSGRGGRQDLVTLITDAPLGITCNQGRGFALKGTSVLEHLRHVLLNHCREWSTRHRSNKSAATKSRRARHRSILSISNAQHQEERNQNDAHHQDSTSDH